MNRPPDDQGPLRPPDQRRRVSPLNWTSRRALVIRVVFALLFLVALVLISPSYFGWGLAVAATIAAVPISKLRSYAVAFLPYGAAWLIFTVLRSLSDETGVPLRTEYVTRIERLLFNGTTPTIWLQNQFFDPLNLAWYDYLATFVHWSYFFVPHLMAVLLWRKSPKAYTRYLVSTVMVLGVGLVIYFLVPAAPPWLTADRAPQEDIFRVMVNVAHQFNSSLYERTYNIIGDSNPVAAMPSMHQAITFLVALFCFKFGKWIGVAGLTYALAMATALVYTGEHYVIDTLVGSAIATYCFFFAEHWLSMITPLFRPVTPTTPPSTEPTGPTPT